MVGIGDRLPYLIGWMYSMMYWLLTKLFSVIWDLNSNIGCRHYLNLCTREIKLDMNLNKFDFLLRDFLAQK